MTTRTTAASFNPLLARIVALEECRVIERWYFDDDSVQILMTLPMRSLGCGCGVEHCWFVNRDGKTRCWECDAAYVKAREEFHRNAADREIGAPGEEATT